MIDEFHEFYQNLPMRQAMLPRGLRFPVQYAVIRRKSLNNTFGMVRRNRDGSARPHQGWDFYAPIGTRVNAICDGKIAAVRNRGALGLHILLEFEHDFGDGPVRLYATYCHLSQTFVQKGQVVRSGESLGLSGDSGNARGMTGIDAHLHFEIRSKTWAGFGLGNRFSPYAIYQSIPLHKIFIS